MAGQRGIRQRASRTAEANSQRAGFVLLVVLATLVVAGTALAALATASLERVLDAQTAQEELQQRWGTIGLERSLLPHASELFEQLDGLRDSGLAAHGSAGILRDQIDLGGQRFDLILADEEAKANLNSIYHAARLRQVERTVQRLTKPTGPLVTRFQARTPSGASQLQQTAQRSDELLEETPVFPSAFLTWGDVFDMTKLRLTAGDDRMLATVTSQVTLWGSGRLNLERASDEAVMAVCGAVISDGLARRLLDRYREQPEAELTLIIEKEISNTEDRLRLLKLIREGSSTFSLWTEVRSRRFRQQKFAVMQTDPEGQIKTFEIAL